MGRTFLETAIGHPRTIAKKIVDESNLHERDKKRFQEQTVNPNLRKLALRGVAYAACAVGLAFVSHAVEAPERIVAAIDSNSSGHEQNGWGDDITIAGLAYVTVNTINRDRAYKQIEQAVNQQ
ncbi:MAG TPA: hypothetical protein VLF90_00515 [Patescibacteria group bacterium]|nr:hypothetical protein [Patescibacteria group bacterium]